MIRERRLDRARGHALAAYAKVEDELLARVAEEPRPGDLFLLPETADLPIEWLVLECGVEGCLLIPADTNPLRGRTDVGVRAEAPAGPLSLRCGFSARVGSERLLSSRRSGRIEAEALEEALRVRGELRHSAGAPLSIDREAEEDPEYEDWLHEVLRPAWEAVIVDRLGEAMANEAVWPARDADAAELSRRGLRFSIGAYGLAATALLSLGVSLAAFQVWHRQEVRDLRRQWAPSGRTAIANLPLKWLTPKEDEVRGSDQILELEDGAGLIHFILELRDQPRHPRYRVDLLRQGAAEPVWSDGGLLLQGASEISFALPRRLLPPGTYLFHLFGLPAEGRPQHLASYDLWLRLPRVPKAP